MTTGRDEPSRVQGTCQCQIQIALLTVGSTYVPKHATDLSLWKAMELAGAPQTTAPYTAPG